MENTVTYNRALNNLYQLRDKSMATIDSLNIFLIRFGNPFTKYKGIEARLELQKKFLLELEGYLDANAAEGTAIYRRPAFNWLERVELFNCVSLDRVVELIGKSDQRQIQECINILSSPHLESGVRSLLVNHLQKLIDLSSSTKMNNAHVTYGNSKKNKEREFI